MTNNRYTEMELEDLCTEIRAVGATIYAIVANWNISGMPTNDIAPTIAMNLDLALSDIADAIESKTGHK